MRKTKYRFSVTTKFPDYWAHHAGSTQTIQIQSSFQLDYLKIALFDKSNGNGLFTQVPGIWNYRSTSLAWPYYTILSLCLSLPLLLAENRFNSDYSTRKYLCEDFTIVATTAELSWPQKFSWLTGTKILLWDRIALLGIWRHCKI